MNAELLCFGELEKKQDGTFYLVPLQFRRVWLETSNINSSGLQCQIICDSVQRWGKFGREAGRYGEYYFTKSLSEFQNDVLKR